MDGFLIVSFVPLKNAPQSRRNYQLPNHTQSSTVLWEHKSSPRGQGELSKMDQIMEGKVTNMDTNCFGSCKSNKRNRSNTRVQPHLLTVAISYTAISWSQIWESVITHCALLCFAVTVHQLGRGMLPSDAIAKYTNLHSITGLTHNI